MPDRHLSVAFVAPCMRANAPGGEFPLTKKASAHPNKYGCLLALFTDGKVVRQHD